MKTEVISNSIHFFIWRLFFTDFIMVGIYHHINKMHYNDVSCIRGKGIVVDEINLIFKPHIEF